VKRDIYRQILAGLSALCLLSAPAWAEPIDAKIFAERNSFVGLASSVTPSVVSIDVEKHETRQAASLPFADPLFRRFFGDFDQPQQEERVLAGKGSGVIISPDGLVLTNNHVVSDATDIEVTLHDGRKFRATLVGADPSTDVAVVKVDAKTPLPAARIGSSQDLPIGSWLMAVGNPHGLEETVTVGILSGKGREIGAGLYDDFLQTDAAINPGNSGGGLFDSEGELVGINTAVAGQGIGFAIPIEMARKVASDLQAHGKVLRGYLGVAIQELTPSLREALQLPENVHGALLGQVLSDGPAGQAGLQPGDVVIELDGQPVASQRALLRLVAQARVGSSVPIKVWRKGKVVSLSSAVGQRPSQVAESSTTPPKPAAVPKARSSGFQAVALTPEIARRFSLPENQGVLIEEVRQGSAAARAGLRSGDVITQVDGQPVSTVEELDRVLGKSHKPVALLVARGDRQIFLALERST
jgi:serine protease Do